MREAIDKALTMSTNDKAFCYVMRRLGYEIDFNPRHKYATIRSVNGKKATRLYRLGPGYDQAEIFERMRETRLCRSVEATRLYNEFTGRRSFGTTIQPRQARLHGSLKSARKITGLRALYFRYCYLLGVFPKNRQRRPLSPEMREACRKLDRYSDQVRLICRHGLNDLPSVQEFINTTESEIKLLTDYRKRLCRDMDSCHDPAQKEALTAKRNDCT